MLERGRENRETLELINTEMYVPQDHLLRKIDAAVDFMHVYDFVEDLYSPNKGRPSTDPVVLFKMVLLQHLYGLPSLRRVAEEVEMNIAYKWFLGYLINEPTPHFSTISYNFKHRFTEDTVEAVFTWILYEIERAGYLRPEVVFLDATHVKANANIKKKMKKMIPEAARTYEKQLRKEVNADREAHGKKPFSDNDAGSGDPSTKEVTISTTDPESGLFQRGEHKKCFAYEAHTVCDSHGFVLEAVVTAGNIHDSRVFDEVYDHTRERCG